MTVTGTAEFSPKVKDVKLSKSWGAHYSKSFRLESLFCPADAPADTPATDPPPADPMDCAGGNMSSDLAFCGRSDGAQNTLYQCVNNQWQPLQECGASGCQQIGFGQDQCN
jgi:hypothetical protein